MKIMSSQNMVRTSPYVRIRSGAPVTTSNGVIVQGITYNILQTKIYLQAPLASMQNKFAPFYTIFTAIFRMTATLCTPMSHIKI